MARIQHTRIRLKFISFAIVIIGICLVVWQARNAGHISRSPKAADYSHLIVMIRNELARIPDSNPRKLEDAFEDVRSCDLSEFDLTRLTDWFDFILFDSKTKWPKKMPPGFFPEKVMESGKNPGLGICSLHQQGITGHGVSIAIIDYPLLVEHIEYRRNLRWYEELNWPFEDDTASMHATAMTSEAVGKTVGVAPGADLYFIASFNGKPYTPGHARVFSFDYTQHAKAIDRILEINKQLPSKKKIRAISISAPWSPEMQGYKEMSQAVKRAVDQGIFVLSPNIFETYDHNFWYQVLDRDPLGNPDDFSIYSVIPWNKSIRLVKIPGSLFDKYYEEQFDRFAKGEILLVPIDSRTYASPTGKYDYAYFRGGGWSEVQPFLCGLYALACQVKPDITPELFWEKALETGIDRDVIKGDRKYRGRIVSPGKLIQSLRNPQ
jgi:hypothetical protein